MEIILTIFLVIFCYDQFRKNGTITYSLSLEQKELSGADRTRFNKYQTSDLKRFLMSKLNQDKTSQNWHEIYQAIEVIFREFNK